MLTHIRSFFVTHLFCGDLIPTANCCLTSSIRRCSEAFESPDGKFVYYAKREGGIWRVPVEGVAEVLILEKVMAGDWFVMEKGVYFISRQVSSRATIEFFNPTTGRVTPIAPIEKESAGGLAVSSDGRWILYAQVDQVDSDIMMMEPFR